MIKINRHRKEHVKVFEEKKGYRFLRLERLGELNGQLRILLHSSRLVNGGSCGKPFLAGKTPSYFKLIITNLSKLVTIFRFWFFFFYS